LKKCDGFLLNASCFFVGTHRGVLERSLGREVFFEHRRGLEVVLDGQRLLLDEERAEEAFTTGRVL
jgi:hypothetical protein